MSNLLLFLYSSKLSVVFIISKQVESRISHDSLPVKEVIIVSATPRYATVVLVSVSYVFVQLRKPRQLIAAGLKAYGCKIQASWKMLIVDDDVVVTYSFIQLPYFAALLYCTIP